MNWVLPNDSTSPIITAEMHIQSEHGNSCIRTLPDTCVLFEMGMALPFMQARYSTITIMEKLPCFIADSKCIALEDVPQVGFVSGGYGAPAAVDTLETMRALGVKRIIIAGMCGCFDEGINVSDIVIPKRILSEEGTSRHYFGDAEFAMPDESLFDSAVSFFQKGSSVTTKATVTSDSFYRQTFAKEASWRAKGCVGVDMESSALLAVSRYYAIPAVSIMICSDKHPLTEGQDAWQWGNCDFRQARKHFVEQVIDFVSLL